MTPEMLATKSNTKGWRNLWRVSLGIFPILLFGVLVLIGSAILDYYTHFTYELVPRAGAVMVCASIWAEALLLKWGYARRSTLDDVEHRMGERNVDWDLMEKLYRPEKDGVPDSGDPATAKFHKTRTAAVRVQRVLVRWIIATAVVGTSIWGYGALFYN